MKIILTGATGFIGGEVLDQCIQDPAITSILVLSRRELPAAKTSNDKVKVIIRQDLSSYSDSDVEDLKGAEACIWCLGRPYYPWQDSTSYLKANLDYTLAAARVFSTRLAPEVPEKTTFRFVYLSGMLSVMDQDQKLWMMELTRKVKGQNENGLFEVAKKETKFDAYSFRPGGVLPAKPGLFQSALALTAPTIRVNQLAARMVDVCKDGSSQQIFENNDIPLSKA